MRRRNSKVSSINRGARLNLGMIVFLFIFLYIFIYILFYLNKDHITLYQVSESGIAQDTTFNGIILRDEKVYKTPSAGYVAYYVSNDSRVKVAQTVYSVDESGNTLESITSDKTVALEDNDYYQIGNTISDFISVYSDVSFDSVYNFKSEVDNKVFELTSGARYNNLEEALKSTNSSSLNIVKSKKTGTVSYYLDGLENLTKDDITNDYFNDYEYSYTKLATGTLLKKKAPAYKLLLSDTWNIIIPLSEAQYNEYKEKEHISLTFNKTGKKTKADIECYNKGDDYFANLTLYKYAVQFLDERFISIDLITDSTKGLKIPNSSITEKEFYVIPKKVFKMGGDVKSLGVIAPVTKDDGSASYEFTPTTIFYETDDAYYINTNAFKSGTVLQYPDSNDTYTLGKTDTLEGVFVANNGYCEFRYINVLYKNDDYSIVEKMDKYSLSVYDNIVLNASTADEDIIIY